MRVKRGFKARRRRKSVLKLAKGFRGRSKNTIRQAHSRVDKALCYEYRDRRTKKRDFRRLWIVRITAACRARGTNYSRFMFGLKGADIDLNRKMLSEIAIHDPDGFKLICEQAKAALAA